MKIQISTDYGNEEIEISFYSDDDNVTTHYILDLTRANDLAAELIENITLIKQHAMKRMKEGKLYAAI